MTIRTVMWRWLAALCVTGATFGTAVACGNPMTPAQLIADLQDPDWRVRRRAADGLRTEEGVADEAVHPLLRAIEREKIDKAYGAILITLGRSGTPEAKTLIDAKLRDRSCAMRRWSTRALRYWLIETEQLEPDAKLPRDWQYDGIPPIGPCR